MCIKVISKHEYYHYYYYYYYCYRYYYLGCYYCYNIASIIIITFKDHKRVQTIKRIVKTFYLSLIYVIVCKQFENRLYIVRASSCVINPSVDDVLTALASIPQFSQ